MRTVENKSSIIKVAKMLRDNLDTVLVLGLMGLYFAAMKYVFGLAVSTIEFAGVLLTMTSLVLMRKENIFGFVVAIAANIVLLIYFVSLGLPGQSILRIAYFVISVASIYSWLRPSEKSVRHLLPSRTRPWILTLFAGAVAAITITACAQKGVVSALDITMLCLGLGGKIFLVWKKVEAWHIWILDDILGITLFAITGAYMSLFRAVITLGNSIAAAVSWRREIQTQSPPNG